MKYTLTFFIFFNLFLFHDANAQNEIKIDSLQRLIKETPSDTIQAKYYLELSDLTMYSDQKKTFLYLKKADSLYKRTINDKGIAKLYAQKANYFYRIGEIDSARHYLVNSVHKSLYIGDTLRAAVIRNNIGILDHYQGNSNSARDIMNMNIPIFKKYKDSLSLANAYLMKGKIAMTDGYLNIALEETYNALKIHKKIKNDFRIAEDLLQIGIIYQTTDEHKKAIKIFKESIDFYSKIVNEQSKSQVHNYIAISEIKLNNFNQAEKHLKIALSLSEKLDYRANIARSYNHWGDLELAKSNISKAIIYYQKSLAIWKSINSPNNKANLLFSLGRAYMMDKKYLRSINYLDQSLLIANSIKDPEIIGKILLEKSITLEKMNRYKEALTYLKKNKSISDSIFTIEQTKATQELKTIYETEKKEQQIVLQQKEIDLLEQKEKVSKLQKSLLGGSLLLTLGIVGFGFYGFRQKIKRNKLEKEKVDAQLAFKKKELTTHVLHLAKKNEVLESLKQKAEELKKTKNNSDGYQQLIRTINFDLKDDNNWENFSKYFQEVHKDFNSNVKQKFPEVTSNELRLMSLLKMNLSSKEIANILNISQEGIKKARYRLRKKLNITTEESLQDIVLRL